jgi:hypothetical protein
MGAISETMIALLNIERYRRLLEREGNVIRREKLTRLLANEEIKLNTLRSGLGGPA